MSLRYKTLLALGALAWQWHRQYRQHRTLSGSQRSKSKPAELATWEGEGGALSASGAQTGPAPRQP